MSLITIFQILIQQGKTRKDIYFIGRRHHSNFARKQLKLGISQIFFQENSINIWEILIVY